MRANAIWLTLILVLAAPAPALSKDYENKCEDTEGGVKVCTGIGVAPLEHLYEAKLNARNLARINILAMAVGVRIISSTTLFDGDLISELISAQTRGIILSEHIIEETTISGEIPGWKVVLRASVKPVYLEPSTLKVMDARVIEVGKKVSELKPVFQHEDEVFVRLVLSEDAYVSVFSVDQAGAVIKLYPNAYAKQVLVSANTRLEVPDSELRSSGVIFRVRTPEESKTAYESVLVIATKEKADLLANAKPGQAMLADLLKELHRIDFSKWAQRTVGYKVQR